MDTRREFIKKAATLSGAAGLFGMLPASIQRAFAIDPEPGTSYLDAEHVVILMQENRSFDHCYGTLQGVRGFEDPRALSLPNKNPVWLQTDAQGQTYPPFRLNIKETNATWQGSLPHSWTNQVDARNEGKHDRWLEVKQSAHKENKGMPLTMGHYTREDVPFYYALADAFTICDQHFCSSLTGTMPNRLYLWSGTIRGSANGPAKVQNEDVEHEDSASWITFPERLEENNISWKVYQNEISLDVGFDRAEARWLANYGDNPLEWFAQYHVGFSRAHQVYLNRRIAALPSEIEKLKARFKGALETTPEYKTLLDRLKKSEAILEYYKTRHAKWTPENFQKLSQREKNLHLKAFSTNNGDPFYHELTTLSYPEGGKPRRLVIPKGDVLHQLRQDVQKGQLPAVSWIVAPENFSDHPSSAWYGAWYLSETIDILTQNPEIWKKTIFILTYDENDGYFDHVPPFVAPHPRKPETGLTSEGINTEEDFVTLEEELKRKTLNVARESSIGLGYRVPMVIASPWSRGGFVCSQVFDHTSVLQFLENFLSAKKATPIRETNISDWRRAVCGDLTSAFRSWHGEKIPLPTFVPKKPFIEGIHKAQFREAPSNFKSLTPAEIEQVRDGHERSPLLTRQEPGTRPSCPLPYQLYADAKLNRDKRQIEVTFAAGKNIFGAKSAGSPFNVQAPCNYRIRTANSSELKWASFKTWAFAVAAGKTIKYAWPLEDFENGIYHLRIYGPNGFFREYRGSEKDPPLDIHCKYPQRPSELTGEVELAVFNLDSAADWKIESKDNAYKNPTRTELISAQKRNSLILNTDSSFRWYDFTLRAVGSEIFECRFAGRVETGKMSVTDPVIGSLLA